MRIDRRVLNSMVEECFEYFGSKFTVNGRTKTEMKSTINDVGKIMEEIKKVFKF